MNLPDADIEVLVRTDNPEAELVIGYWDGETWRVAGVDLDLETTIGRVLGWTDTDEAIKQIKWNE